MQPLPCARASGGRSGLRRSARAAGRRARAGVVRRAVRDPGRRVAHVRPRNADRARDDAPRISASASCASRSAGTRSRRRSRPTSATRTTPPTTGACPGTCSTRCMRSGIPVARDPLRLAALGERRRRAERPARRTASATSPRRRRRGSPGCASGPPGTSRTRRIFSSPVSPSAYVKQVLNPAYAALHAASGANRVAGGVTSPRKTPSGMAPLAFLQGMRAAHARLDAYAQNPYPAQPRRDAVPRLVLELRLLHDGAARRRSASTSRAPSGRSRSG